MTPARRISRNLVFKALTELIGRALSFVFYIILARTLGDVAFGTFSLVYSVAAVAVFLVDPGLNLLLIRQVPRNAQYLVDSTSPILALKLLLSIVTVFIAAGYGLIAGYDWSVTGLFALTGIQMAAFAITEYISSIFQSQEKMQAETLIMGVGKVAVTGIAITSLVYGAGLSFVVFAMAVAQVSAAGWALKWASGKNIIFRPRCDLARWAALLRKSIPLAGIVFFTMAFYRVDIALAPFLGIGLREIGWYSAGIKILDVCLAIPTLAMAAAFPTLSGMAERDIRQFREWMNLLLMALGVVGILVAIGLIFFAPEIIKLVFGASFVSTISLLKWLGAASLFMFVRHGLINALVLDGKHRVALFLTGIAFFGNIGLNLLLAPGMGIQGLAMVKLLTDLFLVSGGLWVWLRYNRFSMSR